MAPRVGFEPTTLGLKLALQKSSLSIDYINIFRPEFYRIFL